MNFSRWLRHLGFLSPQRRLQWFLPFWLMRVKVLELADEGRRMRFRLPLNAVSRNMGGSMFGGYQASLADPVAAIACARLFPGYAVWTRALEVDFRREGTTDLELRFTFDPALESRIREELAERGRSTPTFELTYHLADGSVCSVVRNTVAIRARAGRDGAYTPRSTPAAARSSRVADSSGSPQRHQHPE